MVPSRDLQHPNTSFITIDDEISTSFIVLHVHTQRMGKRGWGEKEEGLDLFLIGLGSRSSIFVFNHIAQQETDYQNRR